MCKQPKCPTDKWIKHISHAHTHTHTVEYYLAMKNKEILPFLRTWMTLKDIYAERNKQAEENKHFMVSLICGI